MKTHDLAKALTQLGKILRALPNQDLDHLGSAINPQGSFPPQNVGVSLSALAALSKYNKLDWERVVRDLDLPVEIRARDGARDVMGKIITYLAENDAERRRVAQRARESSPGQSELSSALQFLLSNG